MNIQNVLVVGAGQLGSGIAQVCAQAGYNVILNDIDNEAVEHGMKTIDKLYSSTSHSPNIFASSGVAILAGILPCPSLIIVSFSSSVSLLPTSVKPVVLSSPAKSSP